MTSEQARPAGRHPTGAYLGATAAELTDIARAAREDDAATIQTLFPRCGVITLTDDVLLLTDWNPGADLELRRGDVVGVHTRFTGLYGRAAGGMFGAGKPLVLDTLPLGQVYLLVDFQEFTEFTDDRQWKAWIEEWRAAEGV
jgi:hypothetical protein